MPKPWRTIAKTNKPVDFESAATPDHSHRGYDWHRFVGVFSSVVLVSALHMTVIVRTPMYLTAAINSFLKLRLIGLPQVAVLGFSAMMGVGGNVAFGAAPEIGSHLGSQTLPINAKQIFIDNCASCHGEDAGGIKDQGADLVKSTFIKRMSDAELKEFLKIGRQPDSPDSTLKLLMPSFDYLTDEELDQVIAYTRNPK